MQKWLLKILVVGLFIIYNVAFAENAAPAKSIKFAVKNCNNSSQYFKFRNNYPEGEAALYILAKKMNASTTLDGMTPLPRGDSILFVNTFSGTKAIVTGQTLWTKDGAKPEIQSLCGVTASCECDKDGCYHEVQTIGVKCQIDGNGTLQDPYIFVLE